MALELALEDCTCAVSELSSVLSWRVGSVVKASRHRLILVRKVIYSVNDNICQHNSTSIIIMLTVTIKEVSIKRRYDCWMCLKELHYV